VLRLPTFSDEKRQLAFDLACAAIPVAGRTLGKGPPCL